VFRLGVVLLHKSEQHKQKRNQGVFKKFFLRLFGVLVHGSAEEAEVVRSELLVVAHVLQQEEVLLQLLDLIWVELFKQVLLE